MKVRISKDIFLACRTIFEDRPFELGEDNYRYHDSMEIKLHLCTEKTLKKLKTKLENYTEIRGVKTLIRDIKTWIAACNETGGTKRARNCAQAVGLMIEYIRKNGRRHVYERVQGAEEGVMNCYFVEAVRHIQRDDRDGRSKKVIHSMRMEIAYEIFGIKKSTNWEWSAEQVIQMTPADVLHNDGIFLETEELRQDYEVFRDDWADYREQVGRQFLAVGLATTNGVDGNDEDGPWWRRSDDERKLDQQGIPVKVVIDVFKETEKASRDHDDSINRSFWHTVDHRKEDDEDGPTWDGEEEEERFVPEIPIHPYVIVFDLKKHKRIKIHVGNLRPYKFNKNIRKNLVLPKSHSDVIDVLLGGNTTSFKDVVTGKSGGMIVLCQGPPGMGKTLTAEIYAEHLEKALYSIQCSQLGISPEELEEALMKVLARGQRWGAVMLLDEADVYVHERGNDLTQNAIVGVFLRVLEYYSGVLFLTTNRGDLVDDAILSRCVARIPYGPPKIEDQKKIWNIMAEVNGIELDEEEVTKIVEENKRLSGRDIKNLLKLAMAVSTRTDRAIDAKLISEVKVFKPTYDGKELAKHETVS